MIQVFWGVTMWTGSHGHFNKTEQTGRSCHSVVFWIRCCQNICFTKHTNVTPTVEHHKQLIWMQSFEMKIITIENLMSCWWTVREMVCVWEILKFYYPFSFLLIVIFCWDQFAKVYVRIYISIHNLCFFQSGRLFLSFLQSSVGATAISMTFTAFSGTHSLFSSKLQSTECFVQYYYGVWWKTIISHHVQNSGTDLILLHSVTVHWPDRNADQKAGCSSRAVLILTVIRPRHKWQDSIKFNL